MKTTRFTILFLIAATFVACVSPSYYQVYKAVPIKSNNISNADSAIHYSDKNCEIFYDLWDNGGNIGFRFTNNTDSSIFINMEECFFVLNGIAHNYYKNRITTNSKNVQVTRTSGTSLNYFNGLSSLNANYNPVSSNYVSSTGVVSGSSNSVAIVEEKIVCVPAHTSKIFSEYRISTAVYRDCILFRFPTKKQTKSESFSKETSPFVFGNRISYKVGHSGSFSAVSNDFFVNEITNYSEREVIERRSQSICGQAFGTTLPYFKNGIASNNKFYIKYTAIMPGIKH